MAPRSGGGLGGQQPTAYLLIDAHGAIEVRKKPPAPHLRQVAVRISIQISDTWFRRPIPSVDIIVPDDHVMPAVVVQTEPLEENT